MENSEPTSNANSFSAEGYGKRAQAVRAWNAKVKIPVSYGREPLAMTEAELKELDLLPSLTPPEPIAPDWSLVALTYGENNSVAEDISKLLELKLDLIERLRGTEASVFFGQLERLEKVVERVYFGLPPQPTPYWAKLMNLTKTDA